jgi:hypothetical protein
MYEEFKQAARVTLERLAPYVEIVGRIMCNMRYAKEIRSKVVSLPAPRGSFHRYVKVRRTMSFPEWFAFAFGGMEKMVLRSLTVTEHDITLRFNVKNFRLYISDGISYGDIIVLSMLDDYVWERIAGNARSAPEELRGKVDYLREVCSTVREALERPARPADYRGLLRRYTINGKLLDALDDIIEVMFSNGNWADLTLNKEDSAEAFTRSLREITVVLLNGYAGAVDIARALAEVEVDRELHLPREIARVSGLTYKRLMRIGIRGVELALSVVFDSQLFYDSRTTIDLVDEWGKTSVWNLILAHYMLTDGDWEWIYGNVLRFLELSEVTREKVRDVAAVLNVLS